MQDTVEKSIYQIVGNPICIEAEDGKKVSNIILEFLKHDQHVTLSFINVDYNSARIALSKPLKSPLTRSVTSTTSSWLSSSWKPAAKLVMHEIPRTFRPE